MPADTDGRVDADGGMVDAVDGAADDARTDGSSPTRRVRLSPIEDAYLEGDRGFDEDVVRVAPAARRTFLKFDLSAISGTIDEAHLTLTVDPRDTGDGEFALFLGEHSNWEEARLTGATSPEAARQVGAFSGVVDVGRAVTIPLDAEHLSSSSLTLIVEQRSGDDAAFASSEHPSLAGPLLSLQVGEPPANDGGVDGGSDAGMSSPPLAFPGALGPGAYNRGAATDPASARVVFVTNLNDRGPGSLREAIEGSSVGDKSDRFIVFRVSGTIQLSTKLRVFQSNLTILGQTAPEGGITLTGAADLEFGETSNRYRNVIVRYLRFRPDYPSVEADAVSFRNITGGIVDHCSFSWASDEVSSASFATDAFTYSYNIFAEGKTGQIMGSSDTPSIAGDLGAYANLYYNVSHRHPNANTSGRFDIVNNVIYNWNFRLTRTIGGIRLNHINNYYFRNRSNDYAGTQMKVDGRFMPEDIAIYTAGNLVLPGMLTDPAADNWSMWTSFGTWSFNGESYELEASRSLPRSDFQTTAPHPPIGPTSVWRSARDAFMNVTAHAGTNATVDGAGRVRRGWDSVDTWYVTNVRNDTPDPYRYDNRAELIAKAHYQAFQNAVSATPLATHPDDYDSDSDGMPDVWERATFGDLSTSATDDSDGDGYLNLEEYANLVDR